MTDPPFISRDGSIIVGVPEFFSGFKVGDIVSDANSDGTMGNAEILMFHRSFAIVWYPKYDDCYRPIRIEDLREGAST